MTHLQIPASQYTRFKIEFSVPFIAVDINCNRNGGMELLGISAAPFPTLLQPFLNTHPILEIFVEIY